MFAQTIAILFDRPVEVDRIAEAFASRDPNRIEAEGDEAAVWMGGVGSIAMPVSSGTNGGVAIASFHQAWPDGMGDPKNDPMLFGSWTLKYFGWGTFPLALARAAAFCPDRDRGSAIREGHGAFVRCNLSYVFGADNDAPVFPEDRDVVVELRELATIGARLLELPGALAWFHPVGEVLRTVDEVREDLAAQAAGELRKSLWVGRRIYPSGRLAVVETVGMGASVQRSPARDATFRLSFLPTPSRSSACSSSSGASRRSTKSPPRACSVPAGSGSPRSWNPRARHLVRSCAGHWAEVTRLKPRPSSPKKRPVVGRHTSKRTSGRAVASSTSSSPMPYTSTFCGSPRRQVARTTSTSPKA